MDDFGRVEQRVRENVPKAISNVFGRIDLQSLIYNSSNIDNMPTETAEGYENQGSANSISLSRVRRDDTLPKIKSGNTDNRIDMFSNITKEAANSFVLGLLGVLILVILVAVITFGVLKYLG